MDPTTRLADALRSGRLALTAEYVPPSGADGEVIRKQAASLPPGLDAVIVADNYGEIGASAVACSSILAAQGVEPILTITTRDRNRIALQSDVLGAAMLGVANVLCLSGEHQSLGVCPEAAGAFDIDSVQLIQALTTMRDEGVLIGGKPLQSRPALFIGAMANPYLQPRELGLIGLRKKVEAGAQFLLALAGSDVEGFTEWMGAVREAGLHERTHIIAGVGPPSDPAQEGTKACADIAAQVKAIEGVRGIHIFSGGSDDVVANVIQQAGLSRS